MRLIDNAWREFHRLWTIRISLAVGLFNGIAAVLGAFTDVFNPWFLVGISIFVNTAVIPLARLAKQREPEPEPPKADARPYAAPPSALGSLIDPANPASPLSPANPANPASPLHS